MGTPSSSRIREHPVSRRVSVGGHGVPPYSSGAARTCVGQNPEARLFARVFTPLARVRPRLGPDLRRAVSARFFVTRCL
ncbi:MAG TPA: hypothetical protein VEW46_16285, partial [Pyrinomonadaceae bacterium]|nr:hypothetical protein [Pyrinomonadaceae bacterium]